MREKNDRFILFAWLLLLLIFPSVVVSGKDDILMLPSSLTAICEEAFAGDSSINSVVIPKTVESIGEKAFCGCSNLREVYLGKNNGIKIAKNAFEGCGELHFYVYPETGGELYALAHGFECSLLEEGSSFLSRALSLVTSHGGTASILQSSDFATKRLIVQMNGNSLPNISDYNPIDIVRDGEEIFIIQFQTVEETMDCYSMLKPLESVIFVETDSCVEILDDVSASGVVEMPIWDTDDPMGFDVYAPFVEQNGKGKVTIAVIDSGVSKRAAYVGLIRSDGISLTGSGEAWSLDSQMHGSMIAGIIKDCVQNANVDILPIKVVGSNGVANLTMIGAGIRYAVEHGADVINISMNFNENAYVRYCIEKALNAKVEVVVAAGNNSYDIAKVFPANVPGVTVVSGIDEGYEISAISNFGENVSFCAPDSYVISTAFSGITRRGTSFAAPMISSALALVNLDTYHSFEDLINGCLDLGTLGKDKYYGYGLPQMFKLADIKTDSVTIDELFPQVMTVGERRVLSYNILPVNATNKGVSVVCSAPEILTVEKDENGKYIVCAVGTGGADLVLTAENGDGVTAEVSINVVQPVTELTISVAKDRLSLGHKLQFLAEISPANATDIEVIWKTTDPSVATITSDGVLTPLTIGRVGVYAEAADGYGAISETKYIDVIDIPDAESVSIHNLSGNEITGMSFQMHTGESVQLKAEVLPEDAEQMVTWVVEAVPEGSIVVDGSGMLRAVGKGNATIKAIASSVDKIFASVSVVVKQPYLLKYNVNGSGALVSQTEVTKYSGEALGTLPVPVWDYHHFEGWFTSASGGDSVTESTIFMESSERTIYAHWTDNVPSGWVKASEVPSGAMIIERKYRYNKRYYTTSNDSGLSGWIKYDTKRTAWGTTQGPVYSDPSGNGRNVWSERYVTSYRTVYHYFRYSKSEFGSGGSDKSGTSYGSNYYTYDLDNQLTENGTKGNYSVGKKFYYNGVNYITVWECDPLTTQEPNGYGTRWYYQDPVYTYYYYRDTSEESTSYPTGSDISSIVEWVRYRSK